MIAGTKKMKKIDIIGISRLRMGSDGQGIRTLVAAQGCPLRCRYCLNPHSWDGTSQIETLTADELYERLKVDNLYFLATDGGVTFGGGEPLLYSEFISEFVNYIEHKWNIAVETSLNVPLRCLERIYGHVDRFIIDIKSVDNTIYQNYTGSSNERVLENLAWLLERVPAESIMVRVPYIPEYTKEEDVEYSVGRLKELGITELDVFPYSKP